MRYSKAGLLGMLAAGVLLSGCQSSRFGYYSNNSSMQSTAPQPLTPAPSGNVQSSTLPPPTNNVTGEATAAQSAPGANMQIASNAIDLTPSNVAGVWNATVDNQTCKVATPQTKFGQGYRAGPLRCPGELAHLSSWEVQGKELLFYDGSGDTIAQLYSTGGEQFQGQTTTGKAITLTR